MSLDTGQRISVNGVGGILTDSSAADLRLPLTILEGHLSPRNRIWGAFWAAEQEEQADLDVHSTDGFKPMSLTCKLSSKEKKTHHRFPLKYICIQNEIPHISKGKKISHKGSCLWLLQRSVSLQSTYK